MTTTRELRIAQTTQPGPRIQTEVGEFGAGVISGVSLIETGEAVGHGFSIDNTTIVQVVDAVNRRASGVNCRFNHPDLCAGSLGTAIGRFFDARTKYDEDGTMRALADLHLFAADSKIQAMQEHVLNLAETSPESLDMSIAAKDSFLVYVLSDGSEQRCDECFGLEDDDGEPLTKYMRVPELWAADVVDDGAANRRGLFGDSEPGLRAGNVVDQLLDNWPGGKLTAIDVNQQVIERAMERPEVRELAGVLAAGKGSIELSSEDGASRAAAWLSRHLERRGVKATVNAEGIRQAARTLEHDGSDMVAGGHNTMTTQQNGATVEPTKATDAGTTPDDVDVQLSAGRVGQAPANGNLQSQQSQSDADAQLQAWKAAEAERQRQIRALGQMNQGYELGAIIDECLSNLDCTLSMAMDKIQQAKEAQANDSCLQIVAGQDEGEKFLDAASDAILLQAGILDYRTRDAELRKRVDDAQQSDLSGLRPQRMAMLCAQRAGVRNADRMGDRQLFNATFPSAAVQLEPGGMPTHNTSAFPLILANVGNKAFLDIYHNSERSWDQFCKLGMVTNFHTAKRLQLSESPLLRRRMEGAAADSAGFKEYGEDITAGNRAIEWFYTYEMFKNDDIGAFLDIARFFGYGTQQTIEVEVWENIVSNSGAGPTLSDNVALFHSTHANLNPSAAGPPSETLVHAARAAMMTMRGIGEDGAKFPVGGRVKKWLGSPNVTPAIAKVVQARFRGAPEDMAPNLPDLLQTDVVDVPLLELLEDGAHAKAWFAAGDPVINPAYEVAFMDGVREPLIESEVGISVRGVKQVVSMDWAHGPTGGHRGFIRNDGVDAG